MHCVITGAASGIGKALAHRFAQANYTITGVDISEKQAAQTTAEITAAGGDIKFLQVDLASRVETNQLVSRLTNRPPVDVLIHNAGVNQVGYFGDTYFSQSKEVVKVNLLAPMLLSAGLLREQHIPAGSSLVFIASLSHYVSYPGASAYAASKDGLVSYARSLRVSLAKDNIHVLTVFPGPTRTHHARRYSPDNRRAHRRMPPATLANYIFNAVQTRQSILIPGLDNRFFAILGHLFPRLTEWVMRKTILEKLPPR